MKKLLLILLCLPMIGFGQQTYVPDDNIEDYLENIKWKVTSKGKKDTIVEGKKDTIVEATKNNIFKINLFAFAFGEANLSFEKKLFNRISYRLGIASYYTEQMIITEGIPLQSINSSLNLYNQIRVYIKKANRGFYIAPQLVYGNLKGKSTEQSVCCSSKDITKHKYASGIILGHQSFYLINESFVVDYFLGVSWYYLYEPVIAELQYQGDIIYDGKEKIFGVPSFGFSIGYAF